MAFDLSIVVPVFNKSPYLERLFSYFRQVDNYNIELVIIDDNSADNSWELIEQFSAPRSNVIAERLNVNSGVAKARNYGIGISSGKYITFFDPDDDPAGNYLTHCLNFARDEFDLLVFSFVMRTPTVDKPFIFEDATYTSNLKDKLVLRRFIEMGVNHSPWNKLFRRELLYRNSIDFPESRSLGEDGLFCFKCISKSNVVRFSSIIGLVYYAGNPDSLTNSIDRKKVQDLIWCQSQIIHSELVCDLSIRRRSYYLFRTFLSYYVWFPSKFNGYLTHQFSVKNCAARSILLSGIAFKWRLAALLITVLPQRVLGGTYRFLSRFRGQ